MAHLNHKLSAAFIAQDRAVVKLMGSIPMEYTNRYNAYPEW